MKVINCVYHVVFSPLLYLSSLFSAPLPPENSDLHLSYFTSLLLFVCCDVLDSNNFVLYFKAFFSATVICIFVWCIECCCVYDQGQICKIS